MPRRWLLQRLPGPDECRRRLRGTPLARVLDDPRLWHLNRRSVAGAVAVGLFVGWLPLPGQMLVAGAIAVALRVHVPLSLVMVWFTNPLTVAPLGYVAWRVGSTILGTPAPAADAAERVLAGSFGEIVQRLEFIWPAILVGCLVCALASAIVGFLGVLVAWRIGAVRRWRARRSLRASKRAA